MNCGECLMVRVEMVPLGTDGKCPKCGTDYSVNIHGLDITDADLPDMSEPEDERERRTR